jgi:UMF1 family MFS transporter
MDWSETTRQRWYNTRVWAWAVFDIGATIFSMIVLSRYGGLWADEQIGGSVTSFNNTVAVSMAIAGVIQILLGTISDELGRRRIFVVWFTCFCAAACAAMSLAHSLVIGLLLLALANMGYQIGFVFYNAMLADVADERHKARISGIGSAIGYCGSIIGLLVCARFADPSHHNYSNVFWVTAIMFLFFAMPLFLFVRERPGLVHFNWVQSLQNSVGSFITTFRRVARHREMLFFFLGCLLALDAVHTVILNMSLYCKNVVGMDVLEGFKLAPQWKGRLLFSCEVNEIDAFLITSILFSIVGAPIIGHIADKTNRYQILMAVVGLWIGALLLAMFSVQRRLFWLTGPLFGLGFGGIWTVSRAYLLELCHPEERGQMFAIFGLVGRFAAIIGPIVWGNVFKIGRCLFHNDRQAYRLSIAAILILISVGFWILLKARPRQGERVG